MGLSAPGTEGPKDLETVGLPVGSWDCGNFGPRDPKIVDGDRVPSIEASTALSKHGNPVDSGCSSRPYLY